jgi:hypothetical protein
VRIPFNDIYDVIRVFATGQEDVIIEPQESYNLVYRISLSKKWVQSAPPNTVLFDPHLLGYFITPIVLSYSLLPIVAATSRYISWQQQQAESNANTTIPLHTFLSQQWNEEFDLTHPIQQKPLESSLHWSMGTKYVFIPITCHDQIAIQTLASKIIPHHHRQIESTEKATEGVEEGDWLDVCIEWPRVVEVDVSFTMNFTVLNKRERSLRDLVLITLPNSQYVIQQGANQIGYNVLKNYYI